MEITLKRPTQDEPFHLRAYNAKGNAVDTDANPEIGGTGKGMSPSEVLLTAVGSCSAIDVILVMQKQRQEMRDIIITVTGTQVEEHPRVFTDIHLHFDLFGPIDHAKAARAVELSMNKYCLVIRMVEKMAKVTSDFTIHS